MILHLHVSVSEKCLPVAHDLLVRKQLRFMANFYHVVAPRYYLPHAERMLDAMFQNMHTPFEVVSCCV